MIDREPVRVFAEWPKDWEAAFTQLALSGQALRLVRLFGDTAVIIASWQFV